MPSSFSMTEATANINDLKFDPHNPRTHDGTNILAIKRSIQDWGQVERLLVRKANNTLIHGNARLMVLKSLGFKKVKVTYIDCDEKSARMMAVVMNRSGELASWDNTQLAAILVMMQKDEDDMERVGFTDKEAEKILAEAAKNPPEESAEDAKAEASLGDTDPWEPEIRDDSLGGKHSVLSLENDPIFPIENEWGIPSLKPEMMGDIPKGITTWCGEYSDPAATFMCVYKARSIVGLDFTKAILSFYAPDDKFDDVWYDSVEKTLQFLQQRWRSIITPNWSLQPDWPKATHLWNIYRSRYMGRYWQEVGIKVIPDLDWADESTFQYNLLGLPDKIPALCIQMQTQAANAEGRRWRECMAELFKQKTVGQILFYGATSHARDQLDRIVPKSVEQHHVQSVNITLGEKLRKRK